MGSIVGVLETQVRASTQDFERGMDRAGKSAGRFEKDLGRAAQGAARAFGGAMSAIAASQAAQEKSWATLGATILSSFAIGGPVMGAVTAAGAAVGILVAHFKQSGEAARAAAEKWEKEIQARREGLKKLAEDIDRLERANRARALGVTDTQLSLREEDRAIELRRARLAELEAERALRLSQPGAITDPEQFRALQSLETDIRRLKAGLDDMIRRRDLLARLAEAEAEAQKQTADEAHRAAEARLRGLPLGDLKLPGRLSGGQFRSRADAVGLPAETPFADLPGTDLLPFPDPDAMRMEIEKMAREREDELRKERARLDMLAQEIAEPFHQAFARAVVDGFREGFDNLKDIGEALLADWLGMFAHGLSRQVFQPIFNNLVGAAAGGGGGVGSVLQVLPVAVPADAVNAGIATSASLQGTIHALGSDVRTLEEFRRG